MINYIKYRLKIILPLVIMVFMLGGQTLVPANTFACGSSTGSSTSQVINGADPTGSGASCSGSGVPSVIRAAVQVLSIIIGSAAIIMILISGMRYIFAAGDSNKISGAKTTLIYALVGVVVAALAQLLVHFVLYNANNATNDNIPATNTPTNTTQPTPGAPVITKVRNQHSSN